jgi:hypothetical protein
MASFFKVYLRERFESAILKYIFKLTPILGNRSNGDIVLDAECGQSRDHNPQNRTVKVPVRI